MKRRICMVKCREVFKKAYFHRWVEISNVIDASPLVGGHPGGQIKYTLGLVEYEDGKIEQVSPERIQFVN